MTWMQTAVVLTSLTLPALALAQPSPATPLGGPTTTPSGSYLNLSPRRPAKPRPLIQAMRPDRSPAAAPSRSRVVCGMTLVPGDPAIDPGIVAREARPAATPSMRVVEPTICGAPTAR